MVFFYTAAVRLYGLAIRLAALFSPKARLWVAGRRDLPGKMEHSNFDGDWIWFHAASLGEFEQGRPLIEVIKKNHPEKHILLTFYSPSGYEIRKNYENVDIVSYMLLDTPRNAIRFVAAVNPSLAIFVKYELWYHHLDALQTAGIPIALISAQFRPEQLYFKWYGAFFRPKLAAITKIFTANEASTNQLSKIHIDSEVVGDTRLDRVAEVANRHEDYSRLADCLQGERILVAGSTWPEDEKVLLPSLDTSTALIIAPHEVSESRIRTLVQQCPQPAVRLSELDEEHGKGPKSIVVDSIGQLAHIYHIATIAYVGGGFGKGIHNILEPAAFEIPVLIGPRYERFAEARDLVALGACFPVESALRCAEILQRLKNADALTEIRSSLSSYFEQHRGATDRIYHYFLKQKFLA